ncbi:MAG: PTS sugar transporter subunit IIA, partial [bacterium]
NAEEFVASYQEELRSMCRQQSDAQKIPVDEWTESVIEMTQEADLLIIGGLTNETFEGFAGKDYGEEIAQEAHCSVGRVRSNLAEPQSVMKKREKQESELDHIIEHDEGVVRMEVEDKEELFKRIASEFEGEQVNRDEILDALWSRESEQDTYIEDQIAFPHGIVPDLETTQVLLVILSSPVSYNNHGDQAKICVCTVGPPGDRQTHLEIIGSMAELFARTSMKQELLSSGNTSDIREKWLECVNGRRSKEYIEKS